ncbi:DUF1515 family protein [Mesorhizobium sp.]|uniref:DUF1515 family protein n=1 Tax=Mesorhizobium sp. TaxID=1871066 RepID=UPI00257DCADF|nr:DUF1515 family protein [Mesorhizobium sp.]
MAPTSVERTLGILLAKVEGIEKSIAAGDQHRAIVHRRVDDLVEQVGEISTEVATMKADVIDSKKITDEVKQWKQRGIGALFVSGVAGTALGGAVVGFIVSWWDSILRVLRSA